MGRSWQRSLVSEFQRSIGSAGSFRDVGLFVLARTLNTDLAPPPSGFRRFNAAFSLTQQLPSQCPFLDTLVLGGELMSSACASTMKGILPHQEVYITTWGRRLI